LFFSQWESIDSAAESLSHEFSAALVDFFKADGDRMCLPICHLLFSLPTMDHGQLLSGLEYLQVWLYVA
jgi:hypothetical protein